MARLSVVVPRRPRPSARGAGVPLLALAATLLVVAPASAHPFLRGGGEVPVDSLATVTLELAHGCGSEVDGTGEDTLEVALEVPSWLRVVTVAEHPTYRHAVEVVDGRDAVVTWTAHGTAEPAPAFELDVVATGTAGETRHLAVFQACEDGAHRWIGTPEAPADDPAINVRLTAADPARPAPPATPEDGTPDAPAPDAEASDEVAGGDGADLATGGASTGAAPDGASEPSSDDEPADPEVTGGATVTAATDGEVDGGDGALAVPGWAGLVVAAVGGGVVLVLWRARRHRGDVDPGAPA